MKLTDQLLNRRLVTQMKHCILRSEKDDVKFASLDRKSEDENKINNQNSPNPRAVFLF